MSGGNALLLDSVVKWVLSLRSKRTRHVLANALGGATARRVLRAKYGAPFVVRWPRKRTGSYLKMDNKAYARIKYMHSVVFNRSDRADNGFI